jgi:hypothetical protein
MGNVRTARALAVWLTVLLVAGSAWAQGEMSKVDRERALEILHVVSAELKKHYYDPKFHGVDWDAKVTETEAADRARALLQHGDVAHRGHASITQ